LQRPVRSSKERHTIEIPKDKILDMLKEGGKADKIDQAKQELPDQVDPERDSGKLEKLGLTPQDLMSKISGGIPGL
jgi:predicted Rdx family selenoprotein